jgi:dienelactone hydrolase
MTRLYGLEIQTSVVQIPLPNTTLEALLSIPDGARAIIVFAQGRGSCRSNAVDTFLAAQFQHAGFATLLPDLYTAEELQEDLQDAHVRFNVKMLGERLTGVADWLIQQPATRRMSVGFLGASTGGAAALTVSANRPETVNAVVCRTGRPDLTGDALPYVHAPTLLLVGENDHVILSLNEAAADQMPYTHKLIPITSAGHDFQEPGALEQLAAQALAWFTEYLAANRAI